MKLVKDNIGKMLFPVLVLVWLTDLSVAQKALLERGNVASLNPDIRNIYSLVNHPSDPALIVVGTAYSVLAYDPIRNNKSLVAGGTSYGYLEGVGENVQFRDVRGMAHFNETAIIVIDEDNYCLRLVGLDTRRTERYAGTCPSSGNQDGNRLSSAKFAILSGITRVGDRFYIYDSYYAKVRQMFKDFVSTLVSGINFEGMTYYDSKFFYTYRYTIWEYDLTSSIKKNLTGNNYGYIDGSLGVALFTTDLYEIVALTEDILIIQDYSRLRLINLKNRRVSTLVSNNNGNSFLVHNGNVVFEGSGYLYQISAQQIPGLGELIKCDADRNMTIAASESSVLFQPDIKESQTVNCSGCPSTQTLSVGVHTFSYKFTNANGEILNLCNQKVVVDIWEPKCPQDFNVSLPVGEDYMNISLPQPDASGRKYECICYPPSVQLFFEGSHEITFKYQDSLTKDIASCSYFVNVIKQEDPVCYNKTTHVSLRENKNLTDEIMYGDIKMKIDSGIAEIKTADGCYHTYYVHETGKPKCPGDTTIMLPVGVQRLNLSLSQPDVSGTQLRCRECPSDKILSEGSHNITYKYQDSLTKVMVSCSYLVNVKKSAGPACSNETKNVYLKQKGSVTEKFRYGGIELNLVAGVTNVKSADGCYYTYNVHETGQPKCKGDMMITLPVGVQSMNISLPQPDVSGTQLKCRECPSDKILSEGSHNITYKYQDSLTKVMVSCSYVVNVKKPVGSVCSNETKHVYLKKNQNLTEEFKHGHVQLRLEAGTSEIKVADGCFQTYVVHEWSAVERRATLQAEYYVDCKSLSQLSYRVINSNAKHHTKYLQQHCEDCKVDESAPVVQCLNDKLFITWETDYTGAQKTLKTDMKKRMEDALIKFQVKYSGMDISIVHVTSRVVTPVKQNSGLYLKVIINTSCLEKGYVYDEQSDLCDKLEVSTVEVQCPSDMEIVLPASLDRQNVTLPEPEVDLNRLKCIKCQSMQREIESGIYNFSFVYRDKLTNQTTSCHYQLSVSQLKSPACSNETKYISLKPNQTRTDEIKIGEFGISFDVGIHVIKIEEDCYVTYIVSEMSRVEKEVILVVDYPIQCSTLNKMSFSLIDSILLQHTRYLDKYCPVCQIDGVSSPNISCNNDTLSAAWKTAITANQQVKGEDINKKLHGALVKFQSTYPVMDITVITTVPRIISPVQDKNGLNVKVVIQTTCLNKGFFFNQQYDVCMKSY